MGDETTTEDTEKIYFRFIKFLMRVMEKKKKILSLARSFEFKSIKFFRGNGYYYFFLYMTCE